MVRSLPVALPPPGANVAASSPCAHRRLRALGGEVASLAELIGAESILPELGMTPEVAVLASAGFATVSLLVNFWGGVATENKRAELQLEVGAGRSSWVLSACIEGLPALQRCLCLCCPDRVAAAPTARFLWAPAAAPLLLCSLSETSARSSS